MKSLRIISGTARGRKLFSVPGEITRPITDRAKESLFDVIGADIINTNFLDLFAGTGSVGIEALSRGAKFARFVDKHPLAIKTILKNLDITGLKQKAEVLRIDAFKYIAQPADVQFDYIYIAPPQYKDLWKQALFYLDSNQNWLCENAWVIAQIHPIEYKKLSLSFLAEFDQRKYGSTLFVFYSRMV